MPLIPTDLLKKTDYDNKITEIHGKIPHITGLAYAALNPLNNVTNLVKTDDDAKISDIESKYFTMSDYNKLKNEIIDNKIKENKISQ